MQRLDAALARFMVWNHGGQQEKYMPWPHEEAAHASGDDLLSMVKRMNLPKRKV